MPEEYGNEHNEEQVRFREPDHGLPQGTVEAKGRGKTALGPVPGGLRRQGTGGQSGDGSPGRAEGRFYCHGRYRYR